MNNGTVQFFNAVEPRPARTETSGNVTINNNGTPGQPAHFKVNFIITAPCDLLDLVHNVLHWTCVVPADTDEAQYRQVEDQAAQRLPSHLRALADALETQIAEATEKRHQAKRKDD